MKIYQLWLPFIKQRPAKTGFMILLGLISSYCTLLLPLSIGKFMEIIFHTGGGKSKALQLLGIHLQNSLPAFFFFFGIMLSIKFFSNWGYRLLAAALGETFVAHLRLQLFSHHLFSMHQTKVKPSVLLPFSNEVKQMQQYLVKGVIGFVKDSLFLLMGMYVLFSLQPQFTVVVLVLCICFYLLYKWLNFKNKPLSANKRKRQAGLLNYVSEIILQQSAAIHKEVAITTFTAKTKELALAAKKQQVIKTFSAAFTPFLLYLMLGILLALIAWGDSFIAVPGANDALTYILLLMMIFPVFRSFLKIETVWMEGKLSAQKFLKITKPHQPEKDAPQDNLQSNTTITNIS